MYAEFDLVVPDTLDDAVAAMASAGDGVVLPLAGGTNLIVDMRDRRVEPRTLIGLDRVDGLRGIRAGDDGVTLGARTTVTDLLTSREIADAAPSLVESARIFGGQMVRNTATVAGNIAYGSPAADLVPPLMSLDATVTLQGRAGTRTVPLADYYLGYKQTARKPDELIVSVAWPKRPDRSANTFYKLARRAGDAITVTGVAVTVAQADGRCSLARIALGAVGPAPMRARRAEAILEGQALTADLIAAAAAEAAAESSPIDDLRASAEYRRKMVGVLTRRLVSQAWATVQ